MTQRRILITGAGSREEAKARILEIAVHLITFGFQPVNPGSAVGMHLDLHVAYAKEGDTVPDGWQHLQLPSTPKTEIRK